MKLFSYLSNMLINSCCVDNILIKTKLKWLIITFGDKYIKYKSDCDEQLPIKEYLERIRPYLINMIGKVRTFDELKIQLTIQMTSHHQRIAMRNIWCILRVIAKKSWGVLIQKKLFEELFHSHLQSYQVGIQSMKSSNFVLDYIEGFFYHFHKVSLDLGRSYINSRVFAVSSQKFPHPSHLENSPSPVDSSSPHQIFILSYQRLIPPSTK